MNKISAPKGARAERYAPAQLFVRRGFLTGCFRQYGGNSIYNCNTELHSKDNATAVKLELQLRSKL
jgi:hypothetical protein